MTVEMRQCPLCKGEKRIKRKNPVEQSGFDPEGADYKMYARGARYKRCWFCAGNGEVPVNQVLCVNSERAKELEGEDE